MAFSPSPSLHDSLPFTQCWNSLLAIPLFKTHLEISQDGSIQIKFVPLGDVPKSQAYQR